MTGTRPFRLTKTRLLVLAVLLGLICAIPSFAQAPKVSAQACGSFGGVGCGTTCGYVGAIGCGTTCGYLGSVGCGTTCGYVGAVGCGSTCGYVGAIGCGSTCGYVGAIGCGNTCGYVGAVGCGNTCGYVGAIGCGTTCGAFGSIGCGTNCSYVGAIGCGTTCGYVGAIGCGSNCGLYASSYCNSTYSGCGAGAPLGAYYQTIGCGGTPCVGGFSVGCAGYNYNSCTYNSGYGCNSSTYTCPGTGQVVANASLCTSANYTCPGTGQVVANASYCTSASYTCPGTGQVVANASYCTSANYTCPGTAQVVANASLCASATYTCPTSGQVVANASMCTSPGTQYCAVTGTNVAAGACPGSNNVNANGAASGTLVTCPGTQVQVLSSLQSTGCPVICYTPGGSTAINAPGTTCPVGTSSTPPAGTAISTAGTAISTAAGGPVSLTAGWHLLGGPAGTSVSGATGSIYTYQAGDTNYETLPAGTAFKAGVGYWVYVNAAASFSLPTVTAGSVNVTLPAGQWVMIGNAYDGIASVTGADSVLTYDPVAGSYAQVGALQPGAGAWVISKLGGQVTIAAASS